MFNINTRELINVLSLQSNSKDYSQIESYIIKVLKELNLIGKRDTYGNIYVTKGKADLYSCLVCHTDTVHNICKDYKVFQYDSTLFAYSKSYKGCIGIGGKIIATLYRNI